MAERTLAHDQLEGQLPREERQAVCVHLGLLAAALAGQVGSGAGAGRASSPRSLPRWRLALSTR